MGEPLPPKLLQNYKGRGSLARPNERFQAWQRETIDDGWGSLEAVLPPLKTEVQWETCRSIITYNESPDIPFDRSINPYRGCEHGCSYCYARPTHAYLGLSPGLDFESRLYAKQNAAAVLRRELAKSGYQCLPLALGPNTDAYQPIERRLGVTREILEVLLEYRHPVGIVTKSALIERDLDILSELADQNLIHVFVTVTTLDHELARRLEPRATAPTRRLETIKALSAAGIPVGIMFAPVIPVLNDSAMETVLTVAREQGARQAGYVLLRLPHEMKELFKLWLETHYPHKAEHIMSILRQSRGGKEYTAVFGQRMTGSGHFVEMINQRFRLAKRRLELDQPLPPLNVSLFQAPPLSVKTGLAKNNQDERQISLF